MLCVSKVIEKCDNLALEVQELVQILEKIVEDLLHK